MNYTYSLHIFNMSFRGLEPGIHVCVILHRSYPCTLNFTAPKFSIQRKHVSFVIL